MFSFFNKKGNTLPEMQESNKICPVCLLRMHKIAKNDVVIDVCSRCHGVFLDNGELEKIIQMNDDKALIS